MPSVRSLRSACAAAENASRKPPPHASALDASSGTSCAGACGPLTAIITATTAMVIAVRTQITIAATDITPRRARLIPSRSSGTDAPARPRVRALDEVDATADIRFTKRPQVPANCQLRQAEDGDLGRDVRGKRPLDQQVAFFLGQS